MQFTSAKTLLARSRVRRKEKIITKVGRSGVLEVLNQALRAFISGCMALGDRKSEIKVIAVPYLPPLFILFSSMFENGSNVQASKSKTIERNSWTEI